VTYALSYLIITVWRGFTCMFYKRINSLKGNIRELIKSVVRHEKFQKLFWEKNKKNKKSFFQKSF
jgi:hypothetical protein